MVSEELIQRNLIDSPEKMGDWNFYNIGATTLKALKSAKIIPNHDYDDYETKKPDALIVKKPIVIAAIEYKTPQQLRTPKQIEKAIAQELGTARALNAKIYIITDGKKSFWINPKTGNEIIQEDGNKITLNFDKSSTDCINLINKITASISSDNDQIKPPSAVDPLPLAQKVWQDLWAVSGATPENCLYTFVEIFIFKYLSDLGVLQGVHSFYSLISQYGSNTDDDVLDFYAQTIRVKIKQLFPWNPKDKTTIINGTIFVSKDDKAVSGYATVFRRILNRFNDFGTLENIDYDFKSKLFETFLKESISKKNWGQYFTPLKVVRAIVNMVELSAGMKVCDPACGVGKFLLEPILHDLHKYFKVENGKLTPQISLSGFDKGFDKEEQKTIILAKANMLIYMSSMIKENPGITEQFSELFNKTFFLQTNTILGTLAQPIKEEYDLILTNPPYVMSGSSNLKEEIAKQDELKAHYAVSAMGIEGLFMEWIVRALKPNGKAFIVVPDGIMNRSNDKKLRDFILENCIIDAVISLPLNTFFTTNKKTYILALTKKESISVNGIPTLEKQTTPVFTYLCSEIGETRDVYRFDIEQNDLEVASDLFNMFKGAKSKFKSEDKRCKIVSIDAFYDGTHWSIDRWWTREERIDLGIEDERDIISIEDFISLISDTAAMLTELEEPLQELKKKTDEFKYRTIAIKEIFDLTITTNNSHFTKSFVAKNPGNIPVFGATKSATEVSYGYVADNLEDIKYFTDCLTWNIDGSIGLFNRGGRFSLSEKVIPLIVRPEFKDVLDLEYLRFIILAKVQQNPFTYTNKGGKTRLGELKIQIPIDQDMNFCLSAQKHIATLFLTYEEAKTELVLRRDFIQKLSVTIPHEHQTVQKKVSEIFDIYRGSGTYTKSYTVNHFGAYPVFSGNTFGAFANINSYDYDTYCLTWAIDGLAGYVMQHSTPFSATNHRGILIPKNEIVDMIDLSYIHYVIEPIFREAKKGRLGDNGQNEYTSLPPFMIKDLLIPIPVNDDGEISISLQEKISQKYVLMNSCKNDVIQKLNAIISQKFSF